MLNYDIRAGVRSSMGYHFHHISYLSRGSPRLGIQKRLVVAYLNRTELQTEFPTIAKEIPH